MAVTPVEMEQAYKSTGKATPTLDEVIGQLNHVAENEEDLAKIVGPWLDEHIRHVRYVMLSDMFVFLQ